MTDRSESTPSPSTGSQLPAPALGTAIENGWKIFAIFIAVGSIVGLVYSLFTSGQPLIGVLVGASIAGGIATFEIWYIRHPRGKWLRRQPLIILILVTLVVWVAVMTFSLQVLPHLLGEFDDSRYGDQLFGPAFWADMTFSVTVGLVMTTAMRLRSLVGGRVLFNFLTGRYRHPVDEQRIFLFVDLCDSTSIAENLGSVAYHAFLRDFVETVEQPIVRHGGEIYQYVGDEVVATWPVGKPKANARVIRCYFSMLRQIQRRREYFLSRYQVLPEFRSGIHCGAVVAGEIGEHRRQIVFVGDVVNTAARIEGQARALGRGLLVSDTTLRQIQMPTVLSARSIGQISLKGKADPIELFEVVAA